MNEENLQKGAIFTPKNPDIPLMVNVGLDTAPFDWNTGFDIGNLVTKNQGASYSCGGQAISYAGEVLTHIPMSAKYPYTQIYAKGGGSSEPELMRIVKEKGLVDEAVYASYYRLNGDLSVDEPFMEDNDITGLIYGYSKHIFGNPVYVKRNFEHIAQAIRDYGFCIIGITGQNNGTWFSSFPNPPVGDEGLWYHWVCCIGVNIVDGKKTLTFKNSWGNVGDNGKQSIKEDYQLFIWSAFTFAHPIPVVSHHQFNTNLRLGDKGEEVKALQDALRISGEFPKEQISTSYFGSITLKAVKQFQSRYYIPTTGNVFNLTRAQLNLLFG